MIYLEMIIIYGFRVCLFIISFGVLFYCSLSIKIVSLYYLFVHFLILLLAPVHKDGEEMNHDAFQIKVVRSGERSARFQNL